LEILVVWLILNYKQKSRNSLSRGWFKCKKGRMMWTSLPLIQPHLWDSKNNKIA
jgi:hypothetical protein